MTHIWQEIAQNHSKFSKKITIHNDNDKLPISLLSHKEKWGIYLKPRLYTYFEEDIKNL